MIFGLIGEAGMGFYLVGLFAVFWLYPIIFEGLWDGQTPGKRAMNLRVISSDGAPVGWLAACVRNLMRTVDMLPFGYACGVLMGLLDHSGRRLGDLVAGTMVVHVARHREASSVHFDVGAAMPSVPLLPDEQAAVLAFAERAGQLTPSRRIELANLVGPLTAAQGEAGVLRLAAIAHWLMGRH